MSEKHDLELLIRGHVPIIYIESFEERRALDLINKIALKTFLPVFKWSVTEGLQRQDLNLGTQKHVSDPEDVLRHIKASELQGLYILLDFHPYINEPINQRLLKEIAMRFEGTLGKLILISPHMKLPISLDKLSAKFHLRLPNTNELEQLIKEEAALWQKQNQTRVQTDRATLDRLIQNLSGLTYKDAKRIIRNTIMDDSAISETDLPDVMDVKYKLLNQDDVLAFEYETAHFSEIGGMQRLKTWLKQRHGVFRGDDELPKGLDKPKGILLLGVQGCGKSLAAKAVAGVWGVPLLRMDFGLLYNKYMGETERNIRQALHTAEVMAPCVLWIDEIEKGISSGSEDDGTSKRILGTLLTWMAENKHSVFIVATANQIDDLPPELIRKGRLDEIFFVDLPSEEVRERIFRIHFDKRDIPTSDLDLKQLAQASDGFSGSEIEEAVNEGLYSSYNDGKELGNKYILDAIKSTYPLSKTMKGTIEDLRKWAQVRARLASNDMIEPLLETSSEEKPPILKQEKHNPFI